MNRSSTVRCEPDVRGILTVRAAFGIINEVNRKLDEIGAPEGSGEAIVGGGGGVTPDLPPDVQTQLDDLQALVDSLEQQLDALTAPPPPP